MNQKNNDASGISIDWYSFTLFCPDARTKKPNDELSTIRDALAKKYGDEVAVMLLDSGEWVQGTGRRPYPYSYKRVEDNLTLYYGGQDWILFELSGKTCAILEESFALNQLLMHTRHESTRLDIAIDIKPEVGNADALAGMCHYKRSKSRGSQVSSTGTTHYIGSKTSDRFVRVYEYNKPHPRGGLPRIEFVIKKKNAEYAINSILAHGVSYTAQSMLNTFEFEGITVMHHDETISAVRKDRKDAKTLKWLLTQATPAIKRLIANGTIEDAESFFKEHCLPDAIQESMFTNDEK